MITEYSFGKIRVKGTWYNSDILIHQGDVIADWWRKDGHLCDVADLDLVLKAPPDIFILGKGNPGLMKATDNLQAYLKQRNIKLIEQPTREAAITFNRLFSQRQNIAAGFHLTC